MENIFKFKMYQSVYDKTHQVYGTINRRMRSTSENTYRVIVSINEEYIVSECELEDVPNNTEDVIN